MNELAMSWKLGAIKPLATAFVLPPAPLLLLALLGAFWLWRGRPVRGWVALTVGLAGAWLIGCVGFARWIEPRLLDIPAALSQPRVAELRTQALAAAHTRRGRNAVVILGGGREAHAPEYHGPSLDGHSMERLRYGLWLGREVGVPVAFSGGVGWAQGESGPTEAAVAAGIAEREFATPLRWREARSRDTRENAALTVALLEGEGIERLLLVTHGWHMPRAVRAFRQAAGGRLEVEPAPMGLALPSEGPILDWTPSSKGTTRVRAIVREWLGSALGA